MGKRYERDGKMDEVRERFLAAAGELFDTHEEGFMTFLKESEDKKQKVAFTLALDFTGFEANIEVGIGYSTSVKDKQTIQIGDPAQGTLPLDGDLVDAMKAGHVAVSFGKPVEPEPTGDGPASAEVAGTPAPEKKKRGRPKKSSVPTDEPVITSETPGPEIVQDVNFEPGGAVDAEQAAAVDGGNEE